jgi:hypothetical protein
VRFVDEVFEGRAEWVPASRLKVRWEQAGPWRDEARRWTAARSASAQARGSVELWAASMVVDAVADLRVLRLGWRRDAGLLLTSDLDGMSVVVGVDPAVVTDDPLAFCTSEGLWVAPWEVTRRVVECAARRHAARVLALLEKDENAEVAAAARRALLEPASTTGVPGDDSGAVPWRLPMRFASARAVVRQWCGAQSGEEHRELQALRTEVARLGALIEQAVGLLRRGGDLAAARWVEEELGVPVRVLGHRREGESTSAPSPGDSPRRRGRAP